MCSGTLYKTSPKRRTLSLPLHLTGDEAGVLVVCACTVNILVSCEVSGGGVVVQTLFKTAKNVLRWLLELALMVNNISEGVNPSSLFR